MHKRGNTQLQRLIAGALLGAGLLACAPGCKVVRSFFPSDQIELSSELADADRGVVDAQVPMSSVSTRGMEIRLWVVDDTDWAAARGLEPYLDDVAGKIDESTALRWSDWGFRMVFVPIDQVQSVLGALRPVQPINMKWLGEFGQWRAIVRAGELETNRVRVGDESVEIERGRPRLIARSWVEPILDETGVVPGIRLDLGVQIEHKKKASGRELFAVDHERLIEDDGPVLDELIASLMFDGTHALVIVGEAPEAMWSLLPAPALVDFESASGSDSESTEGSPAFGPAPGERPQVETDSDSVESETRRQQPSSSSNVLPAKPMGKTLGELMLTSPGSRVVRLNETRAVPKRVVVVLVPRIEGGFSLLPGVEQQSGGAAP